MAVTVTPNLTLLYNANSSIGGLTTYSGFQRFGSACNGGQVSNGTDHFTTTVSSFSLVGNSLYSWMIGPGSINTVANGGYRIVIGDGTNTRAYYVGGSDRGGFFAGGWFCFAINGDNLPTQFAQVAGSAQPNLSALTVVGVGFSTVAKAVGNSPNVFFDVARYGTGLTISGGTSGDKGNLKEVSDLDLSTSNAWGILREVDDGIYQSQGRLILGSNSAETYFAESDAILSFINRPVGNSFYQLGSIGSASHTNQIEFGVRSGDSGLQGNIIKSGQPLTINFSDANVNHLIYGSTIDGASQGVTLGNNVNDEFISNTVVRSAKINPNSSFIRSLTVIETSDSVAGFLWKSDTDIEDSNFIGNSTHAIEHDQADTFAYNDIQLVGNDTDVINTSDGNVVINVFGGVSPTVTNQGTSTTEVNNPVLLRLTGLELNTEVRIFRASDRVELAGVENTDSSTFDYAYNYTEDIEVYIVIHNVFYEYVNLSNITLTQNDLTIPVQKREDRNYLSS